LELEIGTWKSEVWKFPEIGKLINSINVATLDVIADDGILLSHFSFCYGIAAVLGFFRSQFRGLIFCFCLD
jgi:hypothetical protein